MCDAPWRFGRLPTGEASSNPFPAHNPFSEQLAGLVLAWQIEKGGKSEGFSQGTVCLPLRDGKRLAGGVRAVQWHVGHGTIGRAEVDANAELAHSMKLRGES